MGADDVHGFPKNEYEVLINYEGRGHQEKISDSKVEQGD